jgi:hypothetical protein
VLASPASRTFDRAYDFWVDSWKAALAALATATHTRSISPDAAAGHKAVIAAEQQVVKEFALIVGGNVRPSD